jgi:hypothetical protein
VYIKKRQLCRRCYMQRQARGELDGLTPRHELTNRDYERARADCSICGPDVPVRLLWSHISGQQAQCKTGARAARRRMMYGIELDQLEALIEAAGGCCEICRTPIRLAAAEGVRGPGVDTACLDHDHSCCPGKFTCGKCIRGVVCVACNVKLGYWERGMGSEMPETAVAYLARTPKPTLSGHLGTD